MIKETFAVRIEYICRDFIYFCQNHRSSAVIMLALAALCVVYSYILTSLITFWSCKRVNESNSKIPNAVYTIQVCWESFIPFVHWYKFWGLFTKDGEKIKGATLCALCSALAIITFWSFYLPIVFMLIQRVYISYRLADTETYGNTLDKLGSVILPETDIFHALLVS